MSGTVRSSTPNSRRVDVGKSYSPVTFAEDSGPGAWERPRGSPGWGLSFASALLCLRPLCTWLSRWWRESTQGMSNLFVISEVPAPVVADSEVSNNLTPLLVVSDLTRTPSLRARGARLQASEVAVEAFRRIRNSKDGGISEMDTRVSPGVHFFDAPPKQTGLEGWRRGPTERGIGLWVVPEYCKNSDDRVLFLHGGGYFKGSPREDYMPLLSLIARETGTAVFCPDYRLAPEHPFPAALVDAEAALHWIWVNGPQGSSPCRRLFVFGDSAGGGLALSLCLSLAAHETAVRISGLATVSAYTDLTHSSESYTTRAWDEVLQLGDPIFSWGDPVVERELNNERMQVYYGGRNPRDPLLSPYFATDEQLAALPPSLMMVGNEEQMLCDTVDLGRRARVMNSKVSYFVYPGMWHDWICYAGEAAGQGTPLPEGMDALRRTAEFYSGCPMPTTP
eukprot:Hpha_TRINITY_DN17527_c0_g1::TRINITY_DN17527_c0_g1_i1::g.92529::m.92529/K14731/mlhB, chnC; epsilon-lactone hydrolase